MNNTSSIQAHENSFTVIVIEFFDTSKNSVNWRWKVDKSAQVFCFDHGPDGVNPSPAWGRQPG